MIVLDDLFGVQLLFTLYPTFCDQRTDDDPWRRSCRALDIAITRFPQPRRRRLSRKLLGLRRYAGIPVCGRLPFSRGSVDRSRPRRAEPRQAVSQEAVTGTSSRLMLVLDQ